MKALQVGWQRVLLRGGLNSTGSGQEQVASSSIWDKESYPKYPGVLWATVKASQ